MFPGAMFVCFVQRECKRRCQRNKRLSAFVWLAGLQLSALLLHLWKEEATSVTILLVFIGVGCTVGMCVDLTPTIPVVGAFATPGAVMRLQPRARRAAANHVMKQSPGPRLKRVRKIRRDLDSSSSEEEEEGEGEGGGGEQVETVQSLEDIDLGDSTPTANSSSSRRPTTPNADAVPQGDPIDGDEELMPLEIVEDCTPLQSVVDQTDRPTAAAAAAAPALATDMPLAPQADEAGDVDRVPSPENVATSSELDDGDDVVSNERQDMALAAPTAVPDPEPQRVAEPEPSSDGESGLERAVPETVSASQPEPAPKPKETSRVSVRSTRQRRKAAPPVVRRRYNLRSRRA